MPTRNPGPQSRLPRGAQRQAVAQARTHRPWLHLALALAAAPAVLASSAAQPARRSSQAGLPQPQQPLPGPPPSCTPELRRSIAWGVGSSGYQMEGGGAARGPSVWDAFSRRPGAIADGSNASVAADFYRRAGADVELLQRLGVKHFRMSLSWPRLIPGGFAGSPVDGAAVRFYSGVLDALTAAGIQPLVALYHWDMPQPLQDAYAGFTNRRIVTDFKYYADIAFSLFGGRVRRWVTMIEPFIFCNSQYGNGQFAPGVNYGDAGRYACGHHALLAHAAAVQLYRHKYKAVQRGALSFTTLVTWPEPASNSAQDARAAQNKLDFEVGWFLDPIYFGDYPASMRAAKGGYLPRFTPDELRQLNGSLDYVAAACLTARWVSASPSNANGWAESQARPGNGALIGGRTGLPWLAAAPWAQEKALRYLARRYRSPELLIPTALVAVPGEASKPAAGALADAARISFLSSYLDSVCRAVAGGGVRLVAWFAWSFLDAWEWGDGFTTRLGIVRVDYGAGGGLARTPKDSALWLSRHLFSSN